MKRYIRILVLFGLFFGITGLCFSEEPVKRVDESKIVSCIINPGEDELVFYWKDNSGANYYSIGNLKESLETNGKVLLFAVNGGMFNADYAPVGLYIENGILYSPLDTKKEGYGNFYLKPNGVLAITQKGRAIISTTGDFVQNATIRYATQSGPMLLLNGEIHPGFARDSKNRHIRNGVGILPGGKLLFVMSKEKMTFFDFALYFKQKGCVNALFLDGFVSRTYLPEQKWIQLDGRFGVIIGVTKDAEGAKSGNKEN